MLLMRGRFPLRETRDGDLSRQKALDKGGERKKRGYIDLGSILNSETGRSFFGHPGRDGYASTRQLD